MAFPKTKSRIKPAKIKKNLFAKSWGRGASDKWKIDYFDRLDFKKNLSHNEG